MFQKQSLLVVFLLVFFQFSFGQSKADSILQEIATTPSAERLEQDITTLVNFGTRHTLSDTVSSTRGIGAARRWMKKEFEVISNACNNCLEVSFLSDIVKADHRRIPTDTKVVNVMAIQRGSKYPNKYIIMSGDIDSRVSDANNFTSDSPGANDNASGLAGTIEAARILSTYDFPVSIIYVGLSGEEQGLYGGKIMAAHAKVNDWEIIGVLNNDMIGNIEGIDGVIDNSTFRVFSEAISMNITNRERDLMRFYGGEVDGPSRQLARYIDRLTDSYMTNLDAIMIYRLDRFGRGGHHRPFNDAGFPGVRIMETHENYNRQHQDIRTENGIAYGDVLSGVNFDYAAKLTAVNCLTLASLAMAPEAPKDLGIGGAVQPSTKLKWAKSDDSAIIGYKVYWRATTSPTWDNSRFVGNVNEYVLENIVIDNFLFGVAAVSSNGSESLISFPIKNIR